MPTYEDYLAAVDALTTTLSAAERLKSEEERTRRMALDELAQTQRQQVHDLQESARIAAADYLTAARALETGPTAELGIRMPERVRPMRALVESKQALRTQAEAARELRRKIAEFEAQEGERATTADAAAAALTARRAALADKPDQPAPEPPPAPEPEESKEPLIGPLGGLPLMWVVIAIPCAVVGMVVLGPELGVVAAGVLALVIAFWLVGLRRVTLGSLLARSGRPVPNPPNGTGSHAGREAGSAHPVPPVEASRPVEPLQRATRAGVMSGFEPTVLENVTLDTHPLMHGEPGLGLAESDFDSAAIKFGQLGELNFAKTLQQEGLLVRFATFWSIHMIGEDLVSKESYDLDCAVVTGNTIWLVDLKYYKSGDVVHRAEGSQFCTYDVATGQQVGRPRKMSRNMDMALTRFKQRFKNYYQYFRVEPRVVLVPTNSGVGRIEGVEWPGGIRAVTLPDFIAELRGEPAFQDNLESKLVRKTFAGLVKS